MNLYEQILSFQKRGIPAVLVTAVKKEDAGPVEVGKKMIVGINNEAYGTVGGGHLEYYAREKCKELFQTRTSLLEEYLLSEGKVVPSKTTLNMVCGGSVTLFYEYIGPKESILIFGAGHVCQALVKILKTMNFHVTVVDDRKEVLSQVKQADMLYEIGFVDYIKQYGVDPNTFIVVSTPSHKHDYHVINQLLTDQIKPRYLGMLCSPQKLTDYLTKTKEKFGPDIKLDFFYSPIGLDLGGGSPEEIAISITSEILAVSNNKKGHRHLRECYDDYDCYWKD